MGKGKVHPSPPAPGPGVETAEGVLLRLLPAAVLAMAAPLGAGGKEVLAYLVLASLRSSAPPTPAREESAARRPHGPELGCGCFDCYTAYWSRWDGSPERDREAIHRAIEAFDEHLARQEEEGKGNRRRKKRAAAKDKAAKGKGKGKAAATVSPQPLAVLPKQEKASSSAVAVLSKAINVVEEQKTVGEEEEEASTAVALSDGDGDGVQEERRRRVWGAVAAVFNWRGWTLWGSH